MRAVPDLQQALDYLFLSFYIKLNPRFQCSAAVVQFATYFFLGSVAALSVCRPVEGIY